MTIAKSIVHSGLSALMSANRVYTHLESAVERARMTAAILRRANHFSVRWIKDEPDGIGTNAHGEKFRYQLKGGWEMELSTDHDRGDGVHGFNVWADRGESLPYTAWHLIKMLSRMTDEKMQDADGELIAYGPPAVKMESKPATAAPVASPYGGCDYHGVFTPGCGKCSQIVMALCHACYFGGEHLCFDGLCDRGIHAGQNVGCFAARQTGVEVDLDSPFIKGPGKLDPSLS